MTGLTRELRRDGVFGVLLLVGMAVKGVELIAAFWLLTCIFPAETPAMLLVARTVGFAWLADTLPGLTVVIGLHQIEQWRRLYDAK